MQYCATSARQGCRNCGGMVAMAPQILAAQLCNPFPIGGGGGAYYAPRIYEPSYDRPWQWMTIWIEVDHYGVKFFLELYLNFYINMLSQDIFFQYHTFVWLYDFFIKMSRKHNRYRNWIQLQKIICRDFFPQLIPIWINWWSYRGHISTVKNKVEVSFLLNKYWNMSPFLDEKVSNLSLKWLLMKKYGSWTTPYPFNFFSYILCT